jgi:hypothetical protein
VDNLFFAFIYFVVIIIFVVIKLRKKKGSERKPWTYGRDSSGGQPSGTAEGAGTRGGFPPGRRIARTGESLPNFLKELLSGEEPDSGESASAPANDSDEDALVEAAWRRFRSETEPQAPAPRPEKPSPAGTSGKAAVPAEPAETAANAERESAAGTAEKFTVPERASALGFRSEEGPAARGEAAAGRSGIPARAHTAEDFSARLARLGPLQRALVMAEVLGKPKALRAGEEL